MSRSIVLLGVLSVLAGCSSGVAVSHVEADASPPPWCTPLTEANRACDVDPLTAFEEAFGFQPDEIYACNGPATSATPATCQDWTTGQCGVTVWGCGHATTP